MRRVTEFVLGFIGISILAMGAFGCFLVVQLTLSILNFLGLVAKD